MINGMLLEHNGEDIYPWVDEVNKSVFAFFQWRVTLEVTDTAPRPQLSVSEEQREGGNITVSCAVLHTCPSFPPSLSFGDQRGVVQGYHTEEIQGRWRVLSTISFVARAEDHEKVVACNVTHPGGQTAAGEVVLDVSYAPRSVSVSGGSTVVQVGTNLSLSCVSDANPPASSYLWYLLRDGLVMPLNHSTETAAVTDLHPDENAFHCIAINPLGRSKHSSSFVVTAEYKPSILANSSCSYHTGQVICRCQARARPRAKVLWMVDGGPLFPGSDPTTSPQNHTVMDIWTAEGTYENVSVTCLANNTYGHDKLLLSVFVKAPPTNVSISQLPARPLEGEKVTLSCLGHGHLPFNSYRWYRVFGEQSVLLKEDSGSLSLYVTRDVGQFRCSALNEMGECSSDTIHVNVEYAPAILPFSFCSVNDVEVRCECVVDSHPVAKIIWTPWSIQDNQTHNITDLLNWRILRSIFIGQKVDDMGDVLCNSTNEHGSAFLKLPFIAGETSAQRSLFYGGVGGALLLVLSFATFLFWRFYSTKRRDCHVALEEVELKGALQVIHNDPTDCPVLRASPSSQSLRMHSFMGGGLFCAIVGNILLVVSTATDYWMQYRLSGSFAHQGLWRYCMSGKCYMQTDSIAYWNATRAFMILSAMSCFVGIIAGILSFAHFSAFERFNRSFAAGIMFFVSTLFVLLAMAIYTGVTVNFLGKRFGDWRFSWSYILGWVALLMTFFAGIFYMCAYRMHECRRVVGPR
uniref:Lens fiber membrane intrinsic protein n=1 Tax=Hucho hucho TaxID=62062 RepID=A0A4W5NT52_9TELE